MKKTIYLSLLATAFASAASAASAAKPDNFQTLAGSGFVKSFVVTPTSTNNLVLTVSGLGTQYSELSFAVLSGGPLVAARTVGDSFMATFNDVRNANFSLIAATPYTIQITGVTKADLPGGFGLISITALNGIVTPALAVISSVPEPETFAMLLVGLIGAFARRRSHPEHLSYRA